MAFKKGNIPWNSGKTGLQTAWNKGVKGTGFGRYPANIYKGDVWNKGLKGIHLNPKTEWKKNDPRISGDKQHSWEGGITKLNHKLS